MDADMRKAFPVCRLKGVSMQVPRVGQEYQTKHGTLIISSLKTSEHEIETYGAKKRVYYVHAKGNWYLFLGRFFSLREARKFVMSY